MVLSVFEGCAIPLVTREGIESEEKLKLLFVSKTNLVVFDYGRWIVSTVITVQVGNAALRLVRCFPQFYQCKSGLSLY